MILDWDRFEDYLDHMFTETKLIEGEINNFKSMRTTTLFSLNPQTPSYQRLKIAEIMFEKYELNFFVIRPYFF